MDLRGLNSARGVLSVEPPAAFDFDHHLAERKPAMSAPIVLEEDDCIVHIEYDQLAPVPDPETWTRFVCISDTHNRKFDVPWGDVLLHSGDLTQTGKYEEFQETMEWLCSLPHRLKM